MILLLCDALLPVFIPRFSYSESHMPGVLARNPAWHFNNILLGEYRDAVYTGEQVIKMLTSVPLRMFFPAVTMPTPNIRTQFGSVRLIPAVGIFVLLWSGLVGAAAINADEKSHPSQSWPFLRGPNFDGHAPDCKLLDAFPNEGPPVLWTRTLGAGYSGFTADENRVYTQYQTLGGQYVICLDSETGETMWEYRYDGPYDPAGLYPGPRATPPLGRGHVYFPAPSGLVGSLTRIILWVGTK